jgi:NADPH:quinone reductase-like Zn-dependent oxidoreductase
MQAIASDTYGPADGLELRNIDRPEIAADEILIRVRAADVAGVVEAVGADVTRFQPGDEVFGIGKGTFAEYARAPEDKLAPKPANLSFEQAATVGISGTTALQAVRDHAPSERQRRAG